MKCYEVKFSKSNIETNHAFLLLTHDFLDA